MTSPDISVIIPCYNRDVFLNRALRSLNNQSLDSNRFQVIIVDDGSDKNIELDPNLYEFKIHLFRHPRNLGLPSALNTGLSNTSTRYFVRLDSDDYVHQDFLRVLLLKFQLDQKTVAASVDYIKVDQMERQLGIFSFEKDPIGCAVMFKTEVIKQVGMYNEEMILAEEIEFQKRFEKYYQISHINLPLYRYCQHDGNITKDTGLYEEFKEKIDE
jgi:glycosyltransferase involved in cell wall biosynthesis